MKDRQQIPEKRMVKRLLGYTERISVDDGIANFNKFNPDAIAEIWPQCFLMSVESNNINGKNYLYKYEYVGSIIKDAFGKNPTGEVVNINIKDAPGLKIIEHIDLCARELKTLNESGRFINEKSKVIKYRSCMIPFGKRNKPATHIVVGLSWQSY